MVIWKMNTGKRKGEAEKERAKIEKQTQIPVFLQRLTSSIKKQPPALF